VDEPHDLVRQAGHLLTRPGLPLGASVDREEVSPVAEQRDEPERPDRRTAEDARTGRPATEARMREQARWVDLQVQKAIERGAFDNLPGAGKPLPPLDDDPNWWVKKLIEREKITGVLPEALQLRKDDAELDAQLDRQSSERVVRELLEGFNQRVIDARRQLLGGPPVITPLRDVDAEVSAWRERRRVSPSRSAPVLPLERCRT
jgi:hypothetical protein